MLHELGVGGMGKVYKGAVVGQAGFQRPVVLKALLREQDPGHVRLLAEEARRYAALDHENIGRIFDFERVGRQLCIVLEFIDGWGLADYLVRHRQRGRLPDVELSVFIASRVCRALQYVFEQAAIVHRDVSPSNIMMTREGAVKLIDFGIATRSGTKDSTLTGKPAYMAPEMVLELRADHRSDIFSLGAVLFEMLTLQRLFQGETTAKVLEKVVGGHSPSPREHNPSIPDGVMAILKRALQRDPRKRYASAAEMGGACEHFLYDNGYGPTNLTLKRYLHSLFPAPVARPAQERPVTGTPVIEGGLVPLPPDGSAATPGGPATARVTPTARRTRGRGGRPPTSRG